jgi:hypothetical protein
VREPDATHDPGIGVYVESPIHGSSLVQQGNIRCSVAPWVQWGSGNDPSASWDAAWRVGGSIKNAGMMFYQESANPGSAYVTDLRILSAP